MISYERAGELLDAAAEALPEGIFADLNGGVNLIRETRRSEDGRYIMGLYHHDGMGRWIEIFYGSFLAVYGSVSEEEFAEELKKTLHHELTHHVEDKAGDRTLEKWDEEQTLLWQSRMAEPLHAKSVLFVDDEGTLAEEAYTLFRAAAPEFPAAWIPAPDAREVLLRDLDVTLCMTLAQAEDLAERFPAQDEKILCLGERDILPPLKKARRQLRREIAYLAEELRGEGNG